MEHTSPKRIRIDGCNALVLEAQQLVLADREKIEMLAAADRKRDEVSVKEAADREKIEMLAAADREKIGRKTDRCTEHEAARVKINDEEAQTKRIKIDAEEGEKSCGAEGCGKGNHGQFKSRSLEAMRQHCGTQKHKVFNSAKCPFFDVYSSSMFTLCCKQNNGGISMGGTTESCGVKDSGKEESCGAEGCGKGNSGQYTTTKHAAMLKHCATKKHEVFYFAQFVVVVMFAKLEAVCLSVFNRTTLRLQLEELQHRAIQEPANLQSKQRNLTNAIRRLQP